MPGNGSDRRLSVFASFKKESGYGHGRRFLYTRFLFFSGVCMCTLVVRCYTGTLFSLIRSEPPGSQFGRLNNDFQGNMLPKSPLCVSQHS